MGAAMISPPSLLEFTVAASWGSKMVFSGAADEYNQINSDSAYVYDTVSRQWSKFRIGAAHTWGTAVACDGKIFLAGGDSGSIMWPTAPVTVYIYDVASGQWSTARLNSARPVVAAAAGTTVIFAGGIANNNVDLYDVASGAWTASALNIGHNYSCRLAQAIWRCSPVGSYRMARTMPLTCRISTSMYTMPRPAPGARHHCLPLTPIV